MSLKNKNKGSKSRNFWKAVSAEMYEHKVTFAVYVVLRLLVVLMMVLQIFNGNYENVFLCFLTLVLLLAPAMMQTVFKVDFPTLLEVIILMFIFSAEILGEISDFYTRFRHWDTVLHTMNGFLCAAVGFSLVDILNRNDRFHMQLSPLFVAIVAFCFSMTIGVLWEFFEFTMDFVFGLDMQKDTVVHTLTSGLLTPEGMKGLTSIENISEVTVNGQKLSIGGYIDIGLIDTMEDLVVNFIGAVVFSVLGYFYIKKRKTKSIITGFVPWRKRPCKDTSNKEGEKS